MPGLKKVKHILKTPDLESDECMVVLRNVTTSTDLPKNQRAVVAELGKAGLTLLLPAKLCAEGHCLLLRFFSQQDYDRVKNSPRSVQDKAQRLAVTTRVSKVTPAGSEKCLVVLDLQQFVEKDWQAFVKTFALGQNRVTKLSKRAK